LGELPSTSSQAKAKEQQAPSAEPMLGLTLAPARSVPGAGDQGVVIAAVDPNGRAAESGLQNGDVILDVNRSAVDTPADVGRIVSEAHAQSKRTILMRIKRGDQTSFVAVSIG
jgi:serine protease Do